MMKVSKLKEMNILSIIVVVLLMICIVQQAKQHAILQTNPRKLTLVGWKGEWYVVSLPLAISLA